MDERAHDARSFQNSAASNWTVLLIGGVSGTGKSTVAKAIARRHDADWLQVDDLRLALQWSDVRLTGEYATEALHFFERTPEVWRLPAERLRDAMIAVGEAMTEAVAIVVGNHVVQGDRLSSIPTSRYTSRVESSKSFSLRRAIRANCCGTCSTGVVVCRTGAKRTCSGSRR
jgi:hypothetical protein